jgi:excisionase family DNA binding protein
MPRVCRGLRVESTLSPVTVSIDDTVMTAEEVLAYLQVNLRTVYRLIKAGNLPAVRVGRQWRFRKRDIDAWLDSQRAAVTSAPTRVAAARPSGAPRVLVVDDEWSIREMLSRTLSTSYEVDVAPDAATALDMLRASSHPYNLLIADLRMPGMHGLALIREARGIQAALPVIIITGFSTERSAIEAVNLGVSGYLTKPFHVPQVLEAAARALGA